MTLAMILLATIAGGVLSVLLAASLALTVLQRYAPLLVSFAVGAMLAAAFLGIIPEAQAAGLPPAELGGWILAGLFGFFLLEKAALWRHHHPSTSHHSAPHQSSLHPHELQATVPVIVLGDGLHNFVDGVLIAAAFLTDPVLGLTTAIAIILHEIPQELGDFMVLLAAGLTRRRALLLNALSGLSMVAGGVAGYLMLEASQAMVPVALAVAAASFIYIAVADLIPHLHRQTGAQSTFSQTALMGLGGAAILSGQFLLSLIH